MNVNAVRSTLHVTLTGVPSIWIGIRHAVMTSANQSTSWHLNLGVTDSNLLIRGHFPTRQFEIRCHVRRANTEYFRVTRRRKETTESHSPTSFYRPGPAMLCMGFVNLFVGKVSPFPESTLKMNHQTRGFGFLIWPTLTKSSSTCGLLVRILSFCPLNCFISLLGNVIALYKIQIIEKVCQQWDSRKFAWLDNTNSQLKIWQHVQVGSLRTNSTFGFLHTGVYQTEFGNFVSEKSTLQKDHKVGEEYREVCYPFWYPLKRFISLQRNS